MQKLVMVALMTFSAAASAGYHYAPEVYASTTRYHRMTYPSAWGTLAGAAASTDENQYIGCTTSSYTYGPAPGTATATRSTRPMTASPCTSSFAPTTGPTRGCTAAPGRRWRRLSPGWPGAPKS